MNEMMPAGVSASVSASAGKNGGAKISPIVT